MVGDAKVKTFGNGRDTASTLNEFSQLLAGLTRIAIGDAHIV